MASRLLAAVPEETSASAARDSSLPIKHEEKLEAPSSSDEDILSNEEELQYAMVFVRMRTGRLNHS